MAVIIVFIDCFKLYLDFNLCADDEDNISPKKHETLNQVSFCPRVFLFYYIRITMPCNLPLFADPSGLLDYTLQL
jgi:hypothetical protein